jgi:Zn finger protein HypA/HybF involved in hydrogenase expression
LDFYELPSIFDLIENIPSKLVWKTHIKEKLEKYWKLQVIERSKDKSSLKHLDVKTVHNIWINAGYNIISIMKASIKLKLLTEVYMLQTTRSKFSNRQISASCPLCGSEDEDKIHFILNCPDLASTSKYYIDELKPMLYEIDHDVSVNIVNNDEQ